MLRPTRARLTRACAAVTAAASIALLAGACTGQGGTRADDDPNKPVTINFWHGWSAPSEVKAVNAAIAGFEKAHPAIHVHAVANVNDDKVNQALRTSGPDAPDVISSFSTDNVGGFCHSGALTDLTPFLKKSGIDPRRTFPKPMLDYTAYQGVRCTLPLLGDAYGLYYNKDAFKAAGIQEPPKTWSQFKADAVKLTKTSGDKYSQLGFMPDFHGYETRPSHYVAQWNPVYFDAQGKAQLAKDPSFGKMFTFQKDLVDSLGGYAKLEKYRNTFGDEYGSKNPFHTGQVAMSLDGEWRLGMAEAAGVKFPIGVAPLPVPDDQASTYGKGYITGTIIGVAAHSAKQNAAWEFVKYLTTDTDAVVNFANGIHNVPSTLAALDSPKLVADPGFRTFLDIARNPRSSTTPASPNGGQYITSMEDFAYSYESGRTTDLAGGLARLDAQIDRDTAQAK
ncbi:MULTISPECIES: ABC transporter substrate-binding protein [Streptomycetaceae]|uniref:Probable sugar-binding periplasmic protein n=1 Tax=Streptantibioticus cattleyicolor (strain ATCC 35852 / DSM 46488 / JCM 4925 / NBRC 14057 / NRRL 8057) TaxID=1003195 RepID=F8JR38_STREN|nr:MULTISPECIES: ABC transporter substrate-binding protein [Streptomycetaceae]AEW94135.1 putative extracellular sugar-binding protein (transport associated) [Streptantibioticus cattleyicolor NRRL 8057 = DSM 46488]MYS58800.1 extracellular solute-binding protein [Streptomyces sp. SID5468]CCB74488.1 putative multiple sugar ABC transporter solute-binding protein [Streptantibioticus cattleyicolor NRRL 8057 = DSM 46488]